MRHNMKKKTTPPPVTDFADTHDGNQAKAVYLAAIETETFADPVQPLQTFTTLRTALIAVSKHPVKVIPVFEQHTAGMTDAQKLFIAERVKSYFANTVFGGDESDEESEGDFLTGITGPLRAYIARLERTSLPQVGDIRATLKEVFRKEMERLPETLAALDDKDRLNFLCKLMPFVLPKVEAVAATKGEPGDWNVFG
jgi:hypothetical protein